MTKTEFDLWQSRTAETYYWSREQAIQYSPVQNGRDRFLWPVVPAPLVIPPSQYFSPAVEVDFHCIQYRVAAKWMRIDGVDEEVFVWERV